MEVSLDYVGVDVGGRLTQPKAPSGVNNATLTVTLSLS